MKILIIDDSISKVNMIVETLVDTGIVKTEDISICDNIIDAKRILRKDTFDVLLLDMQLPLRKEQEAQAHAGLDFLKDFKNGNRYHQPREIIGITEHEDELEVAKKDFDDNLLHLIEYSETSDEWKQKLEKRFEYLYACNEEQNFYDYDVAIICALKSPELDAVMKFINHWDEVVIDNDKSTKYYSGTLEGIRIVVASAAQMGMPASTALAMKTIDTFRPRNLFMGGISAGVEDKVKLGDILIADQSWDYGSGKVLEGGVFQIEPYPIRLSGELKANAEELKSDDSIIAKIKKNWPIDYGELNVHIGPMASGASVVSDENFISALAKEQHRKLLGIEMEAYGVMFACNNCAEPKPKVMVVKSVCDFGNGAKNDEYQPYAAYTSASFIFAYIQRYCKH